MTQMGCDSGNFLGAGNGGHWSAVAQAQNSTAQAAYLAYLGTFPGASTCAVPARPAIKDAGIRAGEIIGFRAWAWSPKSRLLWSMSANYAWTPGEPASGDPNAGVGVHAFKTLNEAIGQYSWMASNGSPVVFGRVALWGDVIEHEKGWRAEFGAIDELIMAIPARQTTCKFWKRRDVLDAVRQVYSLPHPDMKASEATDV